MKHKRYPARSRGITMFLALGMLVILSVIALSMIHFLRTDTYRTGRALAAAQNRQILSAATLMLDSPQLLDRVIAAGDEPTILTLPKALADEDAALSASVQSQDGAQLIVIDIRSNVGVYRGQLLATYQRQGDRWVLDDMQLDDIRGGL